MTNIKGSQIEKSITHEKLLLMKVTTNERFFNCDIENYINYGSCPEEQRVIELLRVAGNVSTI